jgi:RHS repeat-associated protein
LRQASLPDGTVINYIIDGDSRRVGKKRNGVLTETFVLDGLLNRVGWYDGTGTLIAQFVYAPRSFVPEYMYKNGMVYKIVYDQVGSVRLVVAQDGSIAQRMDYDEFGAVVLDTAPGFQPFGFAGGLYDRDTRLSRFGSRDYSADIGRWVNRDPIDFDGSQANLYVYVNNDPVNGLDPYGLYQCVGGAQCNFQPPLDQALICFDYCTLQPTQITSGSEITPNHPRGSPHADGQACDIGRNANPSLNRSTAEKCWAICFDTGRSYAQEEDNNRAGTGGTHYHIQTRPGRGGKVGFRPGVAPHR